jgi:hypothetical protein
MSWRARARARARGSVILRQPPFQCYIIRRHGHHTPSCIESNPRTISLLVVAQVGEHRQVDTSYAIPVHAILSRVALMATLRAQCREFASIWQRLQGAGEEGLSKRTRSARNQSRSKRGAAASHRGPGRYDSMRCMIVSKCAY